MDFEDIFHLIRLAPSKLIFKRFIKLCAFKVGNHLFSSKASSNEVLATLRVRRRIEPIFPLTLLRLIVLHSRLALAGAIVGDGEVSRLILLHRRGVIPVSLSDIRLRESQEFERENYSKTARRYRSRGSRVRRAHLLSPQFDRSAICAN